MLIFDQLKRSERELRWVAIGVLLGVGTLLAGLWYVQIAHANRYRAELQDQSIRTVRVPAIRGKILDRNRIPLVENRPSYNVNSYLEELRPHFEAQYVKHVKKEFTNAHPKAALTREIKAELEQQARYRVVSNLLIQASSAVQAPRILLEENFRRHYERDRTLPLPLLRDLSKPQVAMFAERAASLPSLALEPQALRHYPFQGMAAHLLGHLERNDVPAEDEDIAFRFRLPDYAGVKGLEAAFDGELRGKAGVKLVLVNNLQYRQADETLYPTVAGRNVELTIDLYVQRAAEAALAQVETDVRGAVVVLDTNTGDIYAMVSSPSFDPNKFVTGFTREEWESSKFNDPLLTPMVNRAAYGLYPPGSSFKIVVALAALEAGVLDPAEVFQSDGSYRLRRGGRPIRDTAAAGPYDFQRAFYKSSNSYFIEYGLRTGPENILAMARQFHLGELTGLWPKQEAPGVLPSPGELRKLDGSRWMPGDTANLSIGHGEILVTPLQMAVVTAAVANGGKVLKPRLVAQIEPQEGAEKKEIVRFPNSQVRGTINVSAKNLELVQKAMLNDVQLPDGTGRQAAVSGLQIAAKTGTAQLSHGRKEKIVWFVSYAPFENPRYAVVVVVEGGNSGGGTCGPVARRIYEAIIKRPPALLRSEAALVQEGTDTSEQVASGLSEVRGGQIGKGHAATPAPSRQGRLSTAAVARGLD